MNGKNPDFIRYVQNSDLLHLWPADHLNELFAKGENIDLPEGEIIAKTDTVPPAAVWVVMKGCVAEIDPKSMRVKGRITAPGVLSDKSVISESPRKTAAVTETKAELKLLPKRIIMQSINHLPRHLRNAVFRTAFREREHLASQTTLKPSDLSSYFLFRSLSKRHLTTVLSQFTVKSLACNEVICLPGDEAEALFLLKKGVVEYTLPTGEKFVIRNGCFGGISLFFDDPRTAEIRTKSYCELWELSKASFTKLMTKMSGLPDKLKAAAVSGREAWLGVQARAKLLSDESPMLAYLRDDAVLCQIADDTTTYEICRDLCPMVVPPKTALATVGDLCNKILLITGGDAVCSYPDGVKTPWTRPTVFGTKCCVESTWGVSIYTRGYCDVWVLKQPQYLHILRKHGLEERIMAAKGFVKNLREKKPAPEPIPSGVLPTEGLQKNVQNAAPVANILKSHVLNAAMIVKKFRYAAKTPCDLLQDRLRKIKPILKPPAKQPKHKPVPICPDGTVPLSHEREYLNRDAKARESVRLDTSSEFFEESSGSPRLMNAPTTHIETPPTVEFTSSGSHIKLDLRREFGVGIGVTVDGVFSHLITPMKSLLFNVGDSMLQDSVGCMPVPLLDVQDIVPKIAVLADFAGVPHNVPHDFGLEQEQEVLSPCLAGSNPLSGGRRRFKSYFGITSFDAGLPGNMRQKTRINRKMNRRCNGVAERGSKETKERVLGASPAFIPLRSVVVHLSTNLAPSLRTVEVSFSSVVQLQHRLAIFGFGPDYTKEFYICPPLKILSSMPPFRSLQHETPITNPAQLRDGDAVYMVAKRLS